MSYSQVSDQRNESPFKDTLNIPDAHIQEKIYEADDIINGAISDVYILPLQYPTGTNFTPPSIIQLSKTITTLLLYLEQNPNAEVTPGQTVNQSWTAAMAALDAMRTRAKKLLDPTGVELPLSETVIGSFYPNSVSSCPETESTDLTLFPLGLGYYGNNPNNTAPKITMNQPY